MNILNLILGVSLGYHLIRKMFENIFVRFPDAPNVLLPTFDAILVCAESPDMHHFTNGTDLINATLQAMQFSPEVEAVQLKALSILTSLAGIGDKELIGMMVDPACMS